MKTETEELKYGSVVMLDLLRCEYIDGPKLTRKGRSVFPAWAYRIYHKIKCRTDKRYRDKSYEILKYFYENDPHIKAEREIERQIKEALK